VDALSRHATLPLLLRGVHASTGRETPVCPGALQHAWETRSPRALRESMLRMQRTRTCGLHRIRLSTLGLFLMSYSLASRLGIFAHAFMPGLE